MNKLFSYTFDLTPPKPKLHEYAYNEFRISLPLHWRQYPTPEERTLHFQSDTAQAALTISVSFYEVPDDKAQRIAEKMLDARLEAFQSGVQGQVEVLRRTIAPHSSGAGLEISFVGEAEGESVYLYLGFVTARKILNFALVCRPGREEAADLFNEIMRSFHPLLP